MFRNIRIAILLLILVFVALNTWLSGVYSKEWRGSLQVALYPVNADGSEVTANYIGSLEKTDFEKVETFFASQARDYGLNVERPFRFTLAPALTRIPPVINEHPTRLDIMWWSLKFRWFAWRTPNPAGPMVTIRMFLLYYDPAHAERLPDSTGLQKGLLGMAHLYATREMAGTNQVVLAHELLHTLSATDKYDLSTNLPIYPDGYADPDKQPRYPQQQAELMAGRIPLSSSQAEQPESLLQVIIGPSTAREIGWIKK